MRFDLPMLDTSRGWLREPFSLQRVPSCYSSADGRVVLYNPRLWVLVDGPVAIAYERLLVLRVAMLQRGFKP